MQSGPKTRPGKVEALANKKCNVCNSGVVFSVKNQRKLKMKEERHTTEQGASELPVSGCFLDFWGPPGGPEKRPAK